MKSILNYIIFFVIGIITFIVTFPFYSISCVWNGKIMTTDNNNYLGVIYDLAYLIVYGKN